MQFEVVIFFKYCECLLQSVYDMEICTCFSDEQRIKKVKEIFGSAAAQQGEFRQIKRKKQACAKLYIEKTCIEYL